MFAGSVVVLEFRNVPTVVPMSDVMGIIMAIMGVMELDDTIIINKLFSKDDA